MRVLIRLLLTMGLVFVGTSSFAQDQAPPERAGRISVVDGRLTMRAPNEQEWTEAGVNYPVSAGMSFATAPNGRAEMQFGGTTLRLDGRTAITVLGLDQDTLRVSVEDGSVDVRTRVLFNNEEVAFETDHARATVLQAGAYRIDAGVGSVPAHVVTFQGRAEVETDRGRETVRAGDAVEANPAGMVRHMAADVDSIDDWAQMREGMLTGQRSEQYVGDGTPGYEDLDSAGVWNTTPDYGAVWYPSGVPAGWEPYGYGQWVWIEPWGWTWIDNEPWGFVPFHYGRWAFIGGRWGWSPGEREHRRVYAPALVAFAGSDPWRFHSRSARPDHWVPLAPGEIYQAPYTRNVAYLRQVNRSNVRAEALATFDWRQQHGNDLANTRHWQADTVSAPARFDRRAPDPAAAGFGRRGQERQTTAPAGTSSQIRRGWDGDARGEGRGNEGRGSEGRGGWRGSEATPQAPALSAPVTNNAGTATLAPQDGRTRGNWQQRDTGQQRQQTQQQALPNAGTPSSAPSRDETTGAWRGAYHGRGAQAPVAVPQASAPVMPVPQAVAPNAGVPQQHFQHVPQQQQQQPAQAQPQATNPNPGNVGQGNLGQGNLGQGNFGQGGGGQGGGGFRGRGDRGGGN